MAPSKFGLTPEEMADLQKTVQALKAAFCAAGDAITAAAEQLREAYMAAEAAAMARVDMEAIWALFAQEADAEETKRKAPGVIPAPSHTAARGPVKRPCGYIINQRPRGAPVRRRAPPSSSDGTDGSRERSERRRTP